MNESSSHRGRPPLAGIRVVEVADESAAYGTRLLADLGAEVIMVEPPAGGPTRHLGPYMNDTRDGEHGFEHLFLNINKRSVVIALDDADGVERFLALVASADVLVDAGAANPLPPNVDGALLQRVQPQLVRVSVRPYGLEGPWRARTGSHLTALASGGLLSITGDPRDPPTQGAADCGFKLTGHAVATATMLGLHGRDRDGAGAHFHISAQEAVVFSVTQSANANAFTLGGVVPERPGLSNVIECGDGRFAGANVRPDHYAEFLDMITRAGVVHDYTPDDWERGTRGVNSLNNENVAMARRYARLVPRDEFVDTMRAAGQVAMPTYDFDEVAAEPHFRETEQFEQIATAWGESLSVPASPMRDLGSPVELRAAPALGADDSLLDQLELPERIGDEATAGAARRVEPSGLLAGLRVVELSWILAGPIAGRMLASFGADVIRVESRVRPDALRNQPLPDGTRNADLPGLFNCVNTGKRSLTLDLRHDRAKDLLRDVIATADLVIDNYALGSPARMGFDYASLAERNPNLIMVHMPGCGTRGRWARERTLGNLLMASSGFNSLMGFPGREPRGVGIAFPDFTAPHLLVTLALAALRMRDRDGRGSEITIDQLGGTVSMLGAAWARYVHRGRTATRPGNRSEHCAPHGVYPTVGDDRWIAISAVDDRQWLAMCDLMGRGDLADDARFVTLAARKEHEDALDAIVEAWTRTQDRWQLAERLQAVGVAAAAVEDLRDLVTSDPQLADTDHYQSTRQPSAADLEILVDAEPIRLVGASHPLRRAPALGEHSEQVLIDLLGLSSADFDDLVVAGVVN